MPDEVGHWREARRRAASDGEGRNRGRQRHAGDPPLETSGRPSGTRLRTAIGEVEIDAVEQISRDDLTSEDLRRAGYSSPAELEKELALKELGLTESLETGYRLSPRGETVLRSWTAE
ncbi:hypothetical protein ACH35V_15105 [Actinomadura sp. 1N219]|uniref:hypothetical protein n=1 Tax=Actinomadura sp. 1N219 TaxID=3375152 RepID=UPI00378DEF32